MPSHKVSPCGNAGLPLAHARSDGAALHFACTLNAIAAAPLRAKGSAQPRAGAAGPSSPMIYGRKVWATSPPLERSQGALTGERSGAACAGRTGQERRYSAALPDTFSIISRAAS